MSLLRTGTALYADGGAFRLVRRGLAWLPLRSPLASPVSRRLYWRLAPTLARRVYRAETDGAAAPPDPFAVHWVDPARISRFSGRDYPPYRGRWRLFGAVRDGDWDRRPIAEVGRDESHTLRDLFYADRVAESTFHEGVHEHVHDGVPWAETRFVRELLERLESNGGSWHGASTEATVLARCRRLDDLYRDFRESGCESQVERARRGVAHWGFLDGLANEIVVDVARDGELLLVSGKHRLTVARVAGLDRVPVAILVRHAGWMALRDAVARGERDPFDHPDLPAGDGRRTTPPSPAVAP